jgi:hypothetical protein
LEKKCDEEQEEGRWARKGKNKVTLGEERGTVQVSQTNTRWSQEEVRLQRSHKQALICSIACCELSVTQDLVTNGNSILLFYRLTLNFL